MEEVYRKSNRFQKRNILALTVLIFVFSFYFLLQKPVRKKLTSQIQQSLETTPEHFLVKKLFSPKALKKAYPDRNMFQEIHKNETDIFLQLLHKKLKDPNPDIRLKAFTILAILNKALPGEILVLHEKIRTKYFHRAKIKVNSFLF